MPTTTLDVQAIPLSQIRPNPDNPRHVITPEMVDSLAASIQAVGLNNPIKVQRVGDTGDYEVISGHIRLAAVKTLGWEAIPAQVLERTPKEAWLEGYLDNRGQEMTWLDVYLGVETLMKLDPDLSQREVGEKLEIPQQKVSRALLMLKALTPISREAIYMNHVKPGDYQVSENAVYRLTTLGDPQKVEEALPKVLEGKMTEGQVRQLVAQMNGGVASTTAKAKPIPTPVATPAERPERPEGVERAPAPKETQAHSDGLKELVMGGAAGALGGFLAANFKRALGMLTRRYMLHGLAALGVLVLLGGHWAKSLFQGPSKAPADPVPAQAQPVAPPAQPASIPLPIAPKPAQAKKERSRPAAAVPVSVAPPQAGSVIPAWAPEGLPTVQDFAQHFYTLSFHDWGPDLDHLKALLVPEYAPAFQKQYFPTSLRDEWEAQQLVRFFSASGMPQVISGVGDSAVYRVQGQLTLQSRTGRNPKTLSSKAVAVEIALKHVDGLGYRVEKVTEVTPKTSSNTQVSADPLKSVQSGASGVQDAARAVGDSADAAQKVKNLLGL